MYRVPVRSVIARRWRHLRGTSCAPGAAAYRAASSSTAAGTTRSHIPPVPAAPAAPAAPLSSATAPPSNRAPPAASPSSSPAPATLMRFFGLAHYFLLDQRAELNRSKRRGAGDESSDALQQQLGFESSLRRATLATLRAERRHVFVAGRGRVDSVKDPRRLLRPHPEDLARLAHLYDELVRTELPQFDPEAADEVAGQSSQERPCALSFEQYASATQAMLRLATENPPASTSPLPAHLPSSVASDPHYPLKLLSRYYANLSSPASPFSRATYGPALHWWQMQAAMSVLAGSAARPRNDRLMIIRGVLERMQAQPVAPQPGAVVRAGESLYDYAARRETFFRTLLHASAQSGDLNFASSLLPLIPHLGSMSSQAVNPTASASSAQWKPLRRSVQLHVFESFMALLGARMQLGFQEAQRGAAAASGQVFPVAWQEQMEQLIQADLHTDMPQVLELEMQQKSSGTVPAAAASSSAPASSPSLLDVLYHSFRCLSATPHPISISHYNLLLFGLTRTEAATALPVLTEVLDTIAREKMVAWNTNTMRIVLLYAMRGASDAGGRLGAEHLQLIQRALTECHAALAAEAQRLQEAVVAPPEDETLILTLDAPTAQLVVRANAAAVRGADAAADSERVASSLQSLHASWSPLLPSTSAVAAWNSAVVSELGVLGCWGPLERFLSDAGSTLSVSEMRDFMTSTHAEVFAQADQWAHSTTVEDVGEEPQGDASAGAEPTATSATDAPDSSSPSSSMLVSEFLLRWEEAKSSLSPSVRQSLGLPQLLHSAPGVATPANSTYVARALPAAQYLIFHSRRQLIDRSSSSSFSPSSSSSSFTPPRFDLPPAVLASGNNFNTGWLLLCSGWAQHLGEREALRSVGNVLQIVGEAARGVDNEWQEKFKELTPVAPPQATTPSHSAAPPSSESTVATATSAASDFDSVSPTAPPRPPPSFAGEDGVVERFFRSIGFLPSPEEEAAAMNGEEAKAEPPKSGFQKWLQSASSSLVSDFEPASAFSSSSSSGSNSSSTFLADSSSALLDTPMSFKLHPALLHSILYAFSYFPQYRSGQATQWTNLFKQLEPHLHLFDLTQHNPMLVKLFQCGDASAPFFDLLLQHPSRDWPAHMVELAKVWSPLDAHAQTRGRELLAFLCQHTADGAAAGSKAKEGASPPSQPPALSIAELLECMKPFLQRMETNGHLVEMQEWVQITEKQHRALIKQFWPHVHFCVISNIQCAKRLLKTHPDMSQAELRARGHITMQEALAWREGYRRRYRLPGASALAVQRSVAAVVSTATRSAKG